MANKAAPLALLVGPDRKHLTGYCDAVLALLSVPSFNVMYSLQLPSFWIAYENPAITCRANLRRLALMMLAFSRSRNPSRPIADEHEMSNPEPNSQDMISRACFSWAGFDGE